MSSEWRPVTLGDLIEVRHGWPFKSEYFDTNESANHLPIVVAIGNFEYSGGFRFQSTQIKRYTDTYPAEYKLEPSDILLVMTCQTAGGEILGIPARVPRDTNTYLHNQRLGKVVLKSDKASLNFLYWLFLHPSFNRHLVGSATGTKILHTAPSRIESFKFGLPPLLEQERIAATLKALDDRITLLRETNATLEAIAQALFKSWFVDFDPVRAKMAGRVPDGMDEATAALFPDALEETELGLVPKGWRVTKVADVAEVVKGKSYSSKDLVDEYHTALVTLKSFERGGGFRMDGFKPYSGAYKTSQVVQAGDLIVAYTDVTQAAELIGKPAIVVGVEEHATLVASLDVGIVRPDEDNCGRQFLYGLFRTDAFQAHTLAHTSGTTVLHLAKDGVGSFVFPCPPSELIQAFEAVAFAIAARRQTNSDNVRTLVTLRDTLLPRLISGLLRLPEAQAQLEDALA